MLAVISEGRMSLVLPAFFAFVTLSPALFNAAFAEGSPFSLTSASDVIVAISRGEGMARDRIQAESEAQPLSMASGDGAGL